MYGSLCGNLYRPLLRIKKRDVHFNNVVTAAGIEAHSPKLLVVVIWQA